MAGRFHTEEALAAIHARPRSRVLGVPGAGHWMYRQEPDVCFAAVKRFVTGTA